MVNCRSTHSKPTSVLAACLLATALLSVGSAIADTKTVIKNARVFDGVNNRLHENCDVVIVGKLITEACAKSVTTTSDDTVIEAQGKTLLPGLIDSHVHFNLSMSGGRPGMEQARWDYMASMAAAAAQDWFADGFTTVRDMGGLANGLRRTIDAGLLDGPRLYLAGSTISQTGGHGDMLLESQSDPKHSNLNRLGVIQIADGEDQVRKAVRKNFSVGASHIKIMVSGGIASAKSPLFAPQYTNTEIAAAVDEAAMRDGYVSAHVYGDDHIRRALDVGVKSIEHGQYISEPTARLLKKKGAYISPFIASVQSDEIFKHPLFGNKSTPQYKRVVQMKENTKNFVQIMKRVKPKIVFSSDIVGASGVDSRRQRDHEKWIFAESFGNFEALKAMTSVGGELAMETGRNNPYPHKLGVIENNAYADILIVDGNPLEDITAIGGHKEWFTAPARERGISSIRVIIKNGRVYKNSL